MARQSQRSFQKLVIFLKMTLACIDAFEGMSRQDILPDGKPQHV